MKQRTLPVEQLTPREWEVLALVREGLTNEQIASRLGISRDGVKYHVSEILGKLGAGDRIEAARWYDRETRQRAGAFGLFGALFRMKPSSVVQPIAAGAIVVGIVVFIALLGGVLVMQSREGGPPEVLPPDRLSGDERLDELIVRLLNADADELRTMAPGIVMREPDPQTGNLIQIPASEWAPMLASSFSRDLHIVVRGQATISPSRDYDVQLRIVTDSGELHSWQFAIEDYTVVDVGMSDDPASLTGSVVGRFDDYLVLPPADYLPQPPEAHDLTARTGEAEIDDIVEALETRDGAELLAMVQYEMVACGPDAQPFCDIAPQGTPVEALAVTDCGRMRRYEDRSFVERRMAAIAAGASGVHGSAVLPEGYFPAGQSLLIVFVEDQPFSWQSNGLVIEEGVIVGLVNRCGDGASMHPHGGFLVMPPGENDELDPARRSGIEVIDAFLDALEAGDIDTLGGLASYDSIGCVTEQLGIGAPPLCEAGEAEGTLVEVMPMAQCEGHYSRQRDFVTEVLPRLSEPSWSLYAVLDLGSQQPGQDDFRRGQFQIVLHDGSQPEMQQSLALGFDDAGVAMVWYGCGPQHPSELFWTGRSPDWVLAPP